ncbi:MAG: hypothetical protein WA924_06050 [Burkholderiaceae bacterium]
MNPQILLDECRAAGVAVRLDGGKIKLRGPNAAVAAAAERLRPHKQKIIRYLLEQFRFDLVEDEPNPAELHRVNNMAWEFMQADGMSFSEAIKAAAKIVAACDAADCEAAYEDVQQLWERMKQSTTDH